MCIRDSNRPPVKLSGLAGPEVIAAGREVFENNKCFNCHKVFWEGNSDRGPNLGTKQIGLYSEDYIKEQILEPRKKQAPGYDDPKSYKAMPTYYGDDIGDDEMVALVAYLKTLRDPTHMPVEGKFPNQWTWWDDPKIVAEGKQVFEGLEPATEGLNCAVCHGKDGIPMMTGALDFRNENNIDSIKIPDRLEGVVLKDWPDHLWYKRVTRGVVGTPMAPWGMIFPHLYLWKAEAYARTFHDPLEKRTAKRPVPPVPTKEEIEKWKTAGKLARDALHFGRDLIKAEKSMLNVTEEIELFVKKNGGEWNMDWTQTQHIGNNNCTTFRLEDQLPEMEDFVGFKFADTRYNSTEHNPWESYYTDDLKRIVYERYSEDFARLGYTP